MHYDVDPSLTWRETGNWASRAAAARPHITRHIIVWFFFALYGAIYTGLSRRLGLMSGEYRKQCAGFGRERVSFACAYIQVCCCYKGFIYMVLAGVCVSAKTVLLTTTSYGP